MLEGTEDRKSDDNDFCAKRGSDPVGCLCDVTKKAISIDLQPICRVT